jgi:hypothetical protein
MERDLQNALRPFALREKRQRDEGIEQPDIRGAEE